MAIEYLAWELPLLAERIRRLERRIERRQLRDAQNPFALPREEFISYFRLTPEVAMYIIDAIRADLRRQRTTGLEAEVKVLIAIQFYAQGSFQKSVGNQFQFNVSQATTSRCIHAVTDAINLRLLRRWIKFPMTEEDRQRACTKFAVAAQPFEGAIGAIDCTFVNILAPHEHEEAFINHHGNHSLNVQAIVDPDMKLLNINPRFPGARNDAYIWSISPIRRAMEFHYNRGERRTWLIGDAGYPLEPWLMTPLAGFPENTRQFQYTEQLCKARNVVERFFGVFKAVWRCLSYQRVLMYTSAFAAKIVNACGVLHNIRIYHRIFDVEFEEPANHHENRNNDLMDVDEAEHVVRIGPRALAERIQRQIMRDRFPNFRYAED